jgi:hypothetical protein
MPGLANLDSFFLSQGRGQARPASEHERTPHRRSNGEEPRVWWRLVCPGFSGDELLDACAPDPGGEWQGTARLPAGVPAQGGGPGRTDRSHGTHTAIAQRPSPSSSSTSRYDSPKRRYQRVARTMTSGGKRKPGEDRPCSGSGTEATRSHTGSLAARTHDHRRRNSVHTVAHWRRRFRACDRRAWAGRHHPVRPMRSPAAEGRRARAWRSRARDAARR